MEEGRYETAGLEAENTVVPLEMGHICWMGVRWPAERCMGTRLEELSEVQGEQKLMQGKHPEDCMYWQPKKVVCLAVGNVEGARPLMVSLFAQAPLAVEVEELGLL